MNKDTAPTIAHRTRGEPNYTDAPRMKMPFKASYILAVMGDETAGTRVGCAGARRVEDVEDGVDWGLVEVWSCG